MKKILIVIPHYWPGYRFGGPVQSVRNVCAAYRDRADIWIMTRDHDHRTDEPYEGIVPDRWTEMDGVHLYYVSRSREGLRLLSAVCREFQDVLLCGLFEKWTYQILLLHRVGLLHCERLYVAPMGVFSKGALSGKWLKKRAFLCGTRLTGSYRRVIWCYSSLQERAESVAALGGAADGRSWLIAEDLPRAVDLDESRIRIREGGPDDALSVAFISRIVPQKNTALCAEILRRLPASVGVVRFDLYGIVEDAAYWETCREGLRGLPRHIRAAYRGPVEPDRVIEILRGHEVFLFPTKGENYGHVIYEALASGCVPILSDRTPWGEVVDRNCGFVCALEDVDGYASALRELAEAGAAERKAWRLRAVEYARERYQRALGESGYDMVFLTTDREP